MDFVAETPLPPRLAEGVREALRGEGGHWPSELSDEEVRALIDHGVAPLVYRASGLPQLRREAIRAAALEVFLEQDLREILGALHEAGIPVIVLKGSALAYDLYPSPELRPRGDTDLLAPESSASVVSGVMSRLGFREQLTSGDEHGFRQTIFTRPSGASYDIHWSATNTPLFDRMFRFETLMSDSVALPALGPAARGLGYVDALLLACIHRVAHHHDSDRLIWLVDIALIRDRLTRDEHRRFWELAAAGGVIAICSRSIELACDWMSRPRTDVASDFLPAGILERSEPSAVYLDRGITHGGLLLANLRGLTWGKRLVRLWQLAFPPAGFIRQSFPGRSRALTPLLYLYRWGRGIARLFRRAI